MRLEGKVAMITGAAHGMGAVEAKLFAEEGAKVVVADIEDEQGRRVVAEIAESDGEAMFVHLDVSREEEWKAAMEATVARFGALDVLVNNAGLAGSAIVDFDDTETWDSLMDVNAKGVYLGIKRAAAEMRKSGGGSIVNISSIAGFVGSNRVHPGYSASKGAVRLVTKTAAVQLARDGIRVNSVHPGLLPSMRGGVSLESPLRQGMLDMVPLGRPGRREEVAYGVLFLASDEASYVTGTELVIDGGYLAQ